MKTNPFLIKILTTTASVLMLVAVSAGNAYAVAMPGYELPGTDIRPSGYPNFENAVRLKVLQNGANKGFKLKARKRGGYQFFNANPSDKYQMKGGSYKLDAFFDTSGNFLKGTLKIRGRLDTPVGRARGTLMTATLTDFAFDSGLTSSLLGFNTSDIVCNAVIEEWLGSCNEKESVYIALYKGGFDPTLRGFRSNGLSVATVPVPAAVWLFGSGLIVLVGMMRRRKH